MGRHKIDIKLEFDDHPSLIDALSDITYDGTDGLIKEWVKANKPAIKLSEKGKGYAYTMNYERE